MAERDLRASQAARERRWWIPFAVPAGGVTLLGAAVALLHEDGAVRALGRMGIAAGGIALVGIVLTYFWWGRAIMGVRHHDRPSFPFLFSTRGWVQAAAIMLTVGVAGMMDYTMEPDFCQSCHLMVPYYTAWHESTHRGVACIDCHFEPGLQNTLKGKWRASSMLVRYLTATYGSKPHAEISDASCLRSGCHETRVLHGEADWHYTRPNGAVVTVEFDHAPHLGDLRRGKQLRCTSCHSQIVQGEHIAVTLDTCYVCHFKGLRHGGDEEVIGGCTGCHAAPKEQIRLATGLFNHKAYIDRGAACTDCHSDATRGDGEVHKQFCVNCHNKPQDIDRFGDSAYMHQVHITDHKLRCTECHIRIDHHINAAPHLTDDCASCHQSMHAGPAELYRGVGGRGVPDMPSPMYRAQVDCIACHRTRSRPAHEAEVVGQTFVAAQEACNLCHGDDADPQTGKYADRLSEWRRVVDERLATAEAALAAAETAAKTAQLADPERLAVTRKLADARHNVALVRLGHGVHNVNYAVALLNVAGEYANEAVAACKSTAAAPPAQRDRSLHAAPGDPATDARP